jgi:hypothetical protein
VVCPWCSQPATPTNLVQQPHHWCYKRSDHVPDEVLHTAENVVLLHKSCHDAHGQTKPMTTRILAYKISKGYDIFAWIDRLISEGTVKHRPDIYGGSDEEVVEVSD